MLLEHPHNHRGEMIKYRMFVNHSSYPLSVGRRHRRQDQKTPTRPAKAKPERRVRNDAARSLSTFSRAALV